MHLSVFKSSLSPVPKVIPVRIVSIFTLCMVMFKSLLRSHCHPLPFFYPLAIPSQTFKRHSPRLSFLPCPNKVFPLHIFFSISLPLPLHIFSSIPLPLPPHISSAGSLNLSPRIASSTPCYNILSFTSFHLHITTPRQPNHVSDYPPERSHQTSGR